MNKDEVLAFADISHLEGEISGKETILKGYYIEGKELYGDQVRTVRGWVSMISLTNEDKTYYIKADDEFKGVRGTLIYESLGPVRILKDLTLKKMNSFGKEGVE